MSSLTVSCTFLTIYVYLSCIQDRVGTRSPTVQFPPRVPYAISTYWHSTLPYTLRLRRSIHTLLPTKLRNAPTQLPTPPTLNPMSQTLLHIRDILIRNCEMPQLSFPLLPPSIQCPKPSFIFATYSSEIAPLKSSSLLSNSSRTLA